MSKLALISLVFNYGTRLASSSLTYVGWVKRKMMEYGRRKKEKKMRLFVWSEKGEKIELNKVFL